MLSGFFGGDNFEMLLLLFLIFFLLGDKDKKGGKGFFGDDNLIFILILFLFLGDIF